MEFDELMASAPFLELPEREAHVCPYARQFAAWADALCQPLAEGPTPVQIAHAQLQLLHRFFDWRGVVPKAHRRSHPNHRCIFQVFEETYLELRSAELALTPPLLFLPPEPVRAQRPRKPKEIPQQIAHLVIGEFAEDADA